MASRISQMRNAVYPQQVPQPRLAIEETRALMQQVQNAQNPEMALARALQNNPNTPLIANMLKSNGNLEALARMMANTKGIDIMQLINQLQGGQS